MHALGVFHQQSRTDRDQYVVIKDANIPSDKEHNFDKETTSLNYDVEYDYFSIMHYSKTVRMPPKSKLLVTVGFKSHIRSFSLGFPSGGSKTI